MGGGTIKGNVREEKGCRQVYLSCARDCYDTCSLTVTLDDSGRIISVKGDPDHPVTRGITCPRAAGDLRHIYTNRVESPMVRDGDKLVPAAWDTALDRVARQLKQTVERHGPASVLYLAYAGNAGLFTEAFPQRLWFALGATQTDWALCCNSGHRALALHYGSSHGMIPQELPGMDLIVFWGFNAAVSAPHLWSLALEARKNRGAEILVIDPVRTATAKKADLWLQPGPGTDIALVYGLIRILIGKGSVDPDFIHRRTLGFEALNQAAGQWTLEAVETVSGVCLDHLDRAADLYARRRPSATLIGIGLQKCGHGADQVRAIGLIPAVLGQDRGFFYSNGKGFLVNSGLVSGKSLTSRPFRVVEQVALPDLVCRGEFKFIYVSGMNPAMTLPDQNLLCLGLERKDVFVAVNETHWTRTARFADVVLPAPTFFEKQDLVIPWGHDRVRWSPRVMNPVTDSRTEIRVMQDLARRVGVAEPWVFQDPMTVVEQAMAGALEYGTFQDLIRGKVLKLKRKPVSVYDTPSGRIELASSRAADLGFSPLPVQPDPDTPDHGFTLVTSATPSYTSTQFQDVYGPIPAIALVNPQDAVDIGVTEGDRVTLVNDLGRVRLYLRVSDTIPPGVVWSPRQSLDLDGVPMNCLMSCVPQAIGSGPRFHSTRVHILLDGSQGSQAVRDDGSESGTGHEQPVRAMKSP